MFFEQVLSAAEWNDSMGEVGKELLRERIKNKRASEGLEEIPDDLFAKKPKYDVSQRFAYLFVSINDGLISCITFSCSSQWLIIKSESLYILEADSK